MKNQLKKTKSKTKREGIKDELKSLQNEEKAENRIDRLKEAKSKQRKQEREAVAGGKNPFYQKVSRMCSTLYFNDVFILTTLFVAECQENA